MISKHNMTAGDERAVEMNHLDWHGAACICVECCFQHLQSWHPYWICGSHFAVKDTSITMYHLLALLKSDCFFEV
eukprot:scaffold407838_cov52-Prasinocladus_malaysianus.AAC.2